MLGKIIAAVVVMIVLVVAFNRYKNNDRRIKMGESFSYLLLFGSSIFSS